MSVVPETLQASVAQPVNIGIQPAATPRSRARLATEFAVSIFCGLVLAWPFRSYDGSLPSFVALAPVLWIAVNQRKALHTVICAAGFALTWTTFCFSFLWPMTVGG